MNQEPSDCKKLVSWQNNRKECIKIWRLLVINPCTQKSCAAIAQQLIDLGRRCSFYLFIILIVISEWMYLIWPSVINGWDRLHVYFYYLKWPRFFLLLLIQLVLIRIRLWNPHRIQELNLQLYLHSK